MLMLSVLKQSQYRHLMLGQACADFGAWLDTTIIGVLIVYRLDLGMNALTLYTLILIIAFFLGSLVSVFFVDRLPPKSLLLHANFLRAALALMIIFFENIEAVLIIVFLKYFVTALYDPSNQQLIRSTIDNGRLVDALGLSSGVTYFFRAFAPFLGAGMMAIFGYKEIFTFCCLIFVASSFWVNKVNDEKKFNNHMASPSKYNNVYLLTLDVIYKNKELFFLIISMSAIVITIFICESYYVLLLKYIHFSNAKAGMELGFMGIGGILGAISIKKITYKFSPFYLMGFSVAVIGMTMSLSGSLSFCGYMNKSIIISILFLVSGLANAILFTSYTIHMQAVTAPCMIGSVRSLSNAILTIFMMVGPLIGCCIVNSMGVGKTFILNGILSIIIGLILIILYFLSNLLWRYHEV